MPDVTARTVGGRVDGFVYFQGVQRREERVRFDMRLVDGNTGQPVGEAIIPLRVRLR